MVSPKKCPVCGAELPRDRRSDHCPQCLLQLGLVLDVESDSPHHIPATEKPGDWIGPYKLVQVLGEGGCGTVYLAEQEKPVRRRVALKVIKLGMDTAQFIVRFEAERQALALMNHPGIAKVLEAGATQSGRPFFAMELVEGLRITDYCDIHQLSVKNRLQLFIQVCQAIQHAHQKGIIHRDLKPSNLLVTESEHVAVPKVIDFGIAKATSGQELTDKTLFTAFDQFIGTPTYMSPEQAEMRGGDVDTRSDIYSLGVLLYELLTGKPPFEPKRFREAGIDEVRRIIREEEPPRPSTRVNTANTGAEMSPALPAKPARQVHQVSADLDSIVMKALEKDPARRYETATGLADDLQRYLNDEPVVARPPSRTYRFQKMVRRNKVVFGATASVFTALIVGLGFSTWMFFAERAARKRATAAEQAQANLREIAETRAYSSDMNLAAQAAQSQGSLGGVANLLGNWRNFTPDPRGWEWYYLNGLAHHDRLTVTGDTNGLLALCWSPDGGRFAVGGHSGHVTVWNAEDGRKLSQLGGTSTVYGLAWHPQKDQIASASHDGNITLWNISTSAPLRQWRGHTGQARGIAWSSDGQKLVSGGKDGTIGVWNPETGARILRINATNYIQNIALNDAGRLASAGGGASIKLWDMFTGKYFLPTSQTISNGNDAALAWSPDGRLLATGGYDWVVRIWDATTGDLQLEFEGHTTTVMALAWSPDGKQLVSIGRDDGAVKVWEASTGKLVQHFRGHLQGARAAAWNSNGSQIASASLDGTAKIWNTKSSNPSQEQLKNERAASALRWNPDGARLAGGVKGGRVLIWNRTNKTTAEILARHGTTTTVAWHPNGKQIASGGSEGFIKLWDAATGAEIIQVRAFSNDIRTLSWNHQGTLLAAAGQGGQLKLWDSTLQKPPATIDLNFPACFALAWSPDGAQVAATVGHNLKIVEISTGRTIYTIPAHRDMIRYLAWSPNGKRLASGGDDVVARIWDTDSGKLLHTLSGHSGSIYSIAWSPDGGRLVTGSWDRTLKIWNPKTGQELCSIKSHRREITSADWSPDGRSMVSGDLGGEILIHDSSRGYEAEHSSP